MENINPLFNLYHLLDKKVTKEMVDEFVIGSAESLMEEGLSESQSYQRIKIYFRNLAESITTSCINQKRKKPLSKVNGPEFDRLVEVPEIAKRLSITNQQVYNLIKSGKIKSIKISERGTRVTEKDFMEFLRSRKMK